MRSGQVAWSSAQLSLWSTASIAAEDTSPAPQLLPSCGTCLAACAPLRLCDHWSPDIDDLRRARYNLLTLDPTPFSVLSTCSCAPECPAIQRRCIGQSGPSTRTLLVRLSSTSSSSIAATTSPTGYFGGAAHHPLGALSNLLGPPEQV